MIVDITTLTDAEKEKLYHDLKKIYDPDNTGGLSDYISSVREERFNSGFRCVHCGHEDVIRYGKYRGRQRYRCKKCSSTFNDLTSTPIAGSHYPEKWVAYIEYMVQGWTLPQIVKELNIHLSTAFYWRHKVLNSLQSFGVSVMKGIVESDATHFHESYKGQKVPAHRKAKKRGHASWSFTKKKRGLSNEKVTAVTVQDRTGNKYAVVAGSGHVSSEDIKSVLDGKIDPTATFCSDDDPSYKKFARELKLTHEIIPSKDKSYVKKGIYHIQHANNLHSRIKKWLARFNGVSTAYLNNYFYWFTWLDTVSHLTVQKRVEQMLLSVCQKSNPLTISDFRTQ